MPEAADAFLPYTRHEIAADDERAVLDALRSGCITQGEALLRFEAAIAEHAGVPCASAVPSGTVALELALEALGVGPGDEVIVPPITFVATANAVCRRGARPVFADVSPDTLNLDPQRVADLVGARTAGAIAVHFAGHPAEVPALREALGPDRFIVEDAAHALGARLGERPAGSLGDLACFSFHPAKGVTCGEGGAIATADTALHARVRQLRDHGLVRDATRFRGLGLPAALVGEQAGAWLYELHEVGTNGRISELQAALGASQLARLEDGLLRRRALVNGYRAALADKERWELPVERADVRSAWHLFTIRTGPELGWTRAGLFDALRERGIGVQVHYVPVHLQPFYREHFGTGYGDCPVAEANYLRMLSLPLFAGMSDADLSRVTSALAALAEGER